MLKIKLIFADRIQIKEAATGSNYGSHARQVSIKENWLYETGRGPLFTIGCSLRDLGLVKTFEEQQAVAKKYRCYRIHREECQKGVSPREVRYVTEIFDHQSGALVLTEDWCEVLIMHVKLFKSKDQLKDIESALDEADRLAEDLRVKDTIEYQMKRV